MPETPIIYNYYPVLSGIVNSNDLPEFLGGKKVHNECLDYIHNNPVTAGIVEKAEDNLYSSARDYFGMKGMLPLIL